MGNIEMNEFYDLIYDLTDEEIKAYSNKIIDVGAVIRGSHKKCFFMIPDGLLINLFYIGEKEEIKGFQLQFEFKQEDCNNIILFFSWFIAGEFRTENAILLYNGYIDLLRKYLESIGYSVITKSDLLALEKKFGEGGLLAANGVFLRDLKEIDFYRDLFNFNYSSFSVESGKQYVYLIFNQKNGYFKIGFSKNPLKREKTLQAEEPEIAILKIWEKDMSFEKSLHKSYFKQKVRGEWFRFTLTELWELREA
ncbi:GIY-YIG nuclease family protein [Sphingobacterium sp. WOUb80]|uniref:GIY-YIG nuclease family protein n=1 Tax=Sphingobacterium sp. WOUb80 TaxID=3234028 RepID=UPI003CF32804